MGDKTKGLYRKFEVRRVDGNSEPGRKHHGCEYFVLDVTHDKHAEAAILAYVESCKSEYPLLAADLQARFSDPAKPIQPERWDATIDVADKDYTFLLSIIHWAITFFDAVPNDTLMHYTPLPKGIDMDYLRDLVKGVKYPPKLASDEPLAPDPRVEVLKILDDEQTSWRKGVIFSANNAAYQLGVDAAIVALERVRTKLIAAQRGDTV